jgi:hypothetical protein
MGGKRTSPLLASGMRSFESFVLDGLAWPAVMIVIGSTMVLLPEPDRKLSQEQLDALHPLLRFLAKRASRSREVRSGWFTIGCAFVIAITRLMR